MPTDVRRASEVEEYVTDVAYIRHFVEDLAPHNLRLVAALNGFPPPPIDDFDYLELGCGNGDTLVTLAAAFPNARFVGVDFNEEHVAFAKDLASRGNVPNVRFLRRDFAELAHDDLPAFHYIAAFGVLSWVAPDKWRAAVEVSRQKLAPGGLFYASYNSMPGWAAIEPLRHLLVDTSRGVEGTSLDRAKQGVELAKILALGGASFFATNPAATRMLERLSVARPNYVVHEYFHAHWRSMYFGDVARELHEHDLHFVGQLPLYLNYRDLTIPPALMELFKLIEDRLVFEGLKDYVVNEYFRRDLYVKGEVGRSQAHTHAYFESQRFGSLVMGDSFAREVRLPHHTLAYVGPIFDHLIKELSKRSSTVAELSALPELAPFGPQKIRDAIRNLTLNGEVTAMRETAPHTSSPARSLYRVPLDFNRVILEQPLVSRTPFIFASPVAGTGITMTLLDAISMRLATQVAPEMRADWIRSLIAHDPLDLKIAGTRVTDPEEQSKVLLSELEKFYVQKVPRLVRLGILEVAEAG